MAEFVTKMIRYGISLIPDSEVFINRRLQRQKGVFVSFRSNGDGTSVFNTKWWKEAGAESEEQLIDLLTNHEVCGRNYYPVRETPKAMDAPITEPTIITKRKIGAKVKEAVS